jgi:RNA polymerase sigma-70 factor, ECF subfamily
MTAQQWQAEQFEQNRTHLRAVAYRMLGSIAKADDAVQEAWLRMNRSDTQAVENMRGWLTTVVSRIALDMLRARQARREDLVEELIVTLADPTNPEREALMADSVGLALLVVLENAIPGRAPRVRPPRHVRRAVRGDRADRRAQRRCHAPARQPRAATRTRRDSRAGGHSLAEQRRVVEAFLAASRKGDFDALVAVLDPGVVFKLDRGEIAAPATLEVRGPEEVANTILARGRPFAPHARPAIVGGRAGAVVALRGRVLAVVTFTVLGGRVREIDLVADPEKLRRVRV